MIVHSGLFWCLCDRRSEDALGSVKKTYVTDSPSDNDSFNVFDRGFLLIILKNAFETKTVRLIV